jgi:hypothetical protein
MLTLTAHLWSAVFIFSMDGRSGVQGSDRLAPQAGLLHTELVRTTAASSAYKGCCSLFDLQLDAPNSYAFTYNTFIKILYVFRALPCSSSGGLRHDTRDCIYTVTT